MRFAPFCETELRFVSLDKLKAILLALDLKHLAVILNESAVTRWGLQQLMEALPTRYQLTWLKQGVANPTQCDLAAALAEIGRQPLEAIVAIGGGSTIDLAKGISAFYDPKRVATVAEITQGIKAKTYVEKSRLIDIIAVPSTAGTGSEVTQWATIWDAAKSGKYSIDAPELKPKLALIAPELTVTLPPALTVATGLDALSHAVEAYWSKATTPVVQEIAYRSVELMVQNLKAAVQKPLDLKVRETLCRAAVLAGLAFAQTRTTACHSISYPLTLQYGIPHGFAVALTLDAVGRFNQGHFPNDRALFELFEYYGGLKNWLELVCQGVVRLRLAAFGIKRADLPRIVEHAFTTGRMDNNPVELSPAEVAGILEMVL